MNAEGLRHSPCSTQIDLAQDDEDLLYYCDQTISRARAETRAQTSNHALRVLYVVSGFTLAFIIAELTGGILANSLAIMTDAFHMISDLASFGISIMAIKFAVKHPTSRYSFGFGISIMAIKFAVKHPTSRYSFGYGRAEVLGALASIVLIWILTGSLVYVAIERIVHQDYDVDADYMLITSGVGVLFNIMIGAILFFGKAEHSHFGMPHNHSHDHGHDHGRDHGHDHGHGHGHDHSHEKPKPLSIIDLEHQKDVHFHGVEADHDHSHDEHGHGQNINIRAAFVHVLGDLVQSIGVVIAALIIKFTGWEIADPICTFLFSVLVLITTGTVIRDTIRVLMECAPSHIDVEQVRADLLAIPGVIGVHSLRLWSVKIDSAAISVHLDTVKQSDLSKIVYDAHQILQHNYNIDFVTVQAQCSSTISQRSHSGTTCSAFTPEPLPSPKDLIDNSHVHVQNE
uniref:Uncharacterized protein n=2 Tax=Panagrolaimus sp. JU765 TaxID=591449 RepID=A0AC34Q4B9_9BILA